MVKQFIKWFGNKQWLQNFGEKALEPKLKIVEAFKLNRLNLNGKLN